MANPLIVPGDLLVTAGQIRHKNDFSPKIARSQFAQEELARFVIPNTWWRVFDALNIPLPSEGLVEAAQVAPSYRWEPNGADDVFFVAGRAYRVVGITSRVEVAGTDAGAVTAVVKKVASGTDIASGTALHTGSIDLKGTVDTNQALTLSATSSALDIAAGDAIGIDFTGVLTAARGCVTVLLAPAASPDDLRLVGGTFGSASPSIQTGDVKAAGSTTKRARCLLRMPAEYDAGQTLIWRAHAGILTTLPDGAATIDLEAYKSNGEAGIGSDLIGTDATSIKSLTLADKDFTIDGSGLSPGYWLDLRMTIAITDAATGTTVAGILGESSLLADIRG